MNCTHDSGKACTNIYTSGIFRRLFKIYHERGFRFLVRKSVAVFCRCVYSRTFLRFRPRRYFTFRGKRLSYFYHPYNFTWDNERAVEIPIIMRYIESYRGKRILEAGNVLSHYHPSGWDIIDKFEKGRGIIGQDIADYRPSEKYDLIFSVSTLEHVGFDDDVRDERKIIKCLDMLKEHCLAPGGVIIASMPLGYNPAMDEFLFKGDLEFTSLCFMKRLSRYEWAETTKDKLGAVDYGTTYFEASAVVIAEYVNSPQGGS